MLDFKKIIAEEIKEATHIETIEEYIEVPSNKEMGDYSLPCFKLAKEMKKAPQIIANEIKEKLDIDNKIVRNVEVVNGYLNFYIAPNAIYKTVFEEMENAGEKYGECEDGNGKNIVIDYSAPNIAKPFHIGHLRSTVIGGALYKIYKFLGYNVVGINHLGD